MFSILNRAFSLAITSYGNKFSLRKRSRLIQGLDNRFYVKFLQLEICLLFPHKFSAAKYSFMLKAALMGPIYESASTICYFFGNKHFCLVDISNESLKCFEISPSWIVRFRIKKMFIQ